MRSLLDSTVRDGNTVAHRRGHRFLSLLYTLVKVIDRGFVDLVDSVQEMNQLFQRILVYLVGSFQGQSGKKRADNFIDRHGRKNNRTDSRRDLYRNVPVAFQQNHKADSHACLGHKGHRNVLPDTPGAFGQDPPERRAGRFSDCSSKNVHPAHDARSQQGVQVQGCTGQGEKASVQYGLDRVQDRQFIVRFQRAVAQINPEKKAGQQGAESQ